MARRRKNRQPQSNAESAENIEGGHTSTPPPVPPDITHAKRNEAQQASPPKPQYHHYIPRFIIRNFSIDDHLKRTKERHELYYYSLDDGRLQVADVDTSYGVYNMYADVQNTKNLHWVELKFSDLEQTASAIIKQIMNLENKEITMTYTELVDLKKFLWTMSFRYPHHQRQYMEGRFSEPGKILETDFMKAKGRQSLDDVWIENIKGILNENVDDGVDLSRFDITRTDGNIGSVEYIAYKSWTMDTFICIWEAEEPYEFILMDNGFNIWEGDCGLGSGSMAYHYFYPISPQRILVASKVWFKPVLNPIELMQRDMTKRIFGIDHKNSVLAEVQHLPPRVEYDGGLPELGMFLRFKSGKDPKMSC